MKCNDGSINTVLKEDMPLEVDAPISSFNVEAHAITIRVVLFINVDCFITVGISQS